MKTADVYIQVGLLPLKMPFRSRWYIACYERRALIVNFGFVSITVMFGRVARKIALLELINRLDIRVLNDASKRS